MNARTARLLDGSAISLSGLCLVHCLALPIAAAFLPAVSAMAEAEWVHLVFVGFAAPIAAFAFFRPGSQPPRHTKALAGIGIALLLSGALGPTAWEPWITVTGSLALASAHVLNWRGARACRT